MVINHLLSGMILQEVMLSNNDVGRNHITICSKTYEPEPWTTQKKTKWDSFIDPPDWPVF